MSTDREMLEHIRAHLDLDRPFYSGLVAGIDAHLKEPSRSQRLRDAGFTPRESIQGPGGLIRDKFKDEPAQDERKALGDECLALLDRCRKNPHACSVPNAARGLSAFDDLGVSIAKLAALSQPAVPEGCTPADARVLREANRLAGITKPVEGL